MTLDQKPALRCAIYTRKSSEEVSNNPSVHSMLSAKHARPLLQARNRKAGAYSLPAMTTVDTLVGLWTGPPFNAC
jgi:hypothetical protein